MVDTAPKDVVLGKHVANYAAARAEVPLMSNAPTVSLKIVLLDGTILRTLFNKTHTFGDVHRYIITYPFK